MLFIASKELQYLLPYGCFIYSLCTILSLSMPFSKYSEGGNIVSGVATWVCSGTVKFESSSTSDTNKMGGGGGRSFQESKIPLLDMSEMDI